MLNKRLLESTGCLALLTQPSGLSLRYLAVSVSLRGRSWLEPGLHVF